MPIFLFAGLLILLGLFLLLIGMLQRDRLPYGRIIYLDAKQLNHKPDTLYDPESGLTGRPDYLIRNWRNIIPVEIKSSPAPDQPYPGHILQLAAYCHLAEVSYGRRPSYGVIRYRDQSFRVNYTHRLRRKLWKEIDAIKKLMHSTPKRSHVNVGRCQACGFQTACDQSLV